ncbi:MAG TPA: hypothetical protein VEM41_03305 [Actinomycetota bacterium]|nr:hypothetical protein [Actinomycetota bacterium]
MRAPIKVAIASTVLVSAITVAALGLSAASASTHHAAKAAPRMVRASAPLAKSGKAGWQGQYIYNVPSGIGGLFFHYPCPTGRTALNGGFGISTSDPNEATISLIGNAPRADITPLYSEWGWTFVWPGGVSPSGGQIAFNVDCK